MFLFTDNVTVRSMRYIQRLAKPKANWVLPRFIFACNLIKQLLCFQVIFNGCYIPRPKKTFVTLNHRVLLLKLQALGADDSAAAWIKSYLTIRGR